MYPGLHKNGCYQCIYACHLRDTHCYQFFEGTLPFLELGTTAGVEHISASSQNEFSSAITIPNGFIFGNSTQNSVYVRKINAYYSTKLLQRYYWL